MKPNKFIINSDYAQLRIEATTKMTLSIPKTIPSGASYTATAMTTSSSPFFDWWVKTSDGKISYGHIMYIIGEAILPTQVVVREVLSSDMSFDGRKFTVVISNKHNDTLTIDEPLRLDFTFNQFVSPFNN